MAQPGECDLRHAATGCSETTYSRDDGTTRCSQEGVLILIGSSPSVGLPSRDTSRQDATRQRRPGRTPKSAFAMRISSRSTVRSMRLYSTATRRNCVYPGSSARVLPRPPGRSVRDADIREPFPGERGHPGPHDLSTGVISSQMCPSTGRCNRSAIVQTDFHCVHHALAVIARRIPDRCLARRWVFSSPRHALAMALNNSPTNLSLVPPV